MNTDIRIAIGFWEHPKTLRLIRTCGYEGAACLQRLWMWAAQNRPDGSLHGMDEIDVELAAGWRGEDGKLFNAIVGKWIDNENGAYSLHEWIQHNPWACGSVGRESKGRFMRMKATHKEIFALLESKGVSGLSKDFYAKITACDVSLKTIAAMLPGEYPELFDDDGKCLKESRKPKGNQEGKVKQDLGNPQGNLKQTSSNPQGDLKGALSWALRSAQAQSPTPSPMPLPMPFPEASILKTLKGIKDISSSELPDEPDGEAGSEGMGENEGKPESAAPAKQEKIFPEDSDAYRVALFLFNCIAHRKPDFKKPNLQAWARHADLMLRLDKRDLESVQKVIRWCQADTFWQSNILSTAKLREKFDQLDDRMKSNGGGNGAGKQILTASGNPKHSGFTPNSGRDYKTGSANSDPESIRKLIGDEEYERIYGKLP